MTDVAVVGGGVIGSAIAVWLIADGFNVTLFERDPQGQPASVGNAGILALPLISPLARPGVVVSVPRWLMDPLGPLAVRWRDLPALTPWFARFIAAARPHRVLAATEALAFLMKTVIADHAELARRGGLAGYMRRTGALHIYGSTISLRAGEVEWAERRHHGVEAHEVSADEVRAMVPALTGPFVKALLAPDHWTVSSPRAILDGLRARVRARGEIEGAAIDAIREDGDKLAVTGGGKPGRFDRVVVAGGVWSRDLVRKLGLNVTLETERGYNTTWSKPPVSIPLPVFFDDTFVASPLDDGLRVGGAVEFAAVDAPPNFARAAAMRRKMRRYVPDLPEEGGREWMGQRPSTPDSLPVIGPHPRDPRIVFAFGHGHLGLTFAAVTARHVSGLVAGRPRDPHLAPFGIERFQ